MASAVCNHGQQTYRSDLVCLLHEENLQAAPPHADRVKRSSGDPYWSRLESRVWTATLLLGTCLLYCARGSMPICAMSMSEHFGWDKRQSGIVLSSFFWGYCLTQVLGGHLSDKVGGEKVLLLSALTWGLITAVTPLAANVTAVPLLLVSLLRFLMGLLQGRWDRWKPVPYDLEWLRLGERFLLFAGFSPFALGLLYVATFVLRGRERILTFEDLQKGFSLSAQTNVPWKRLFRKAPVWAVIIAQLSVASTSFTLFSWLPTFFKERFPDSKGWIFNVVPWLVAIPAAVLSGLLSDHLITQGYKTVWVRKLMQVIGMGAASAFVFFLGNTTSYFRAVAFASAAVGLQTFNHSGITVNVQDLAPSCAGFLFGVANTGGALLGKFPGHPVFTVWVFLGFAVSISSPVSSFPLQSMGDRQSSCLFLECPA
ncbi:hypothetical protein FKM82_007607 [Ascaphus truei]